MSKPVLFYGQSNVGRIYASDVARMDADQQYESLLLSQPVAPGGPHGEAIYTAIYLTLNHRVEAAAGNPGEVLTLTASLVVDEVETETKTLSITVVPLNRANPPARVRRVYELGFSVPIMRDAIEISRQAVRGVFSQVRLRWPANDIQVIGAHVEHEVVTESRVPA